MTPCLLLSLVAPIAARAQGVAANELRIGWSSLGLATAGLLALEAAHYDPPAAPIILVAIPVAQLAASIAIERATDGARLSAA